MVLIWVSILLEAPICAFSPNFFNKSHPLYDQTWVFGAVFSLFCRYLYCLCFKFYFIFKFSPFYFFQSKSLMTGQKFFFFFFHFVMLKVLQILSKWLAKLIQFTQQEKQHNFFQFGVSSTFMTNLLLFQFRILKNWNYITFGSTPKKKHPLRSLSSKHGPKHGLESLDMVVGQDKLVWHWRKNFVWKFVQSVWH